MYAYLNGKIALTTSASVVIDVNGVGYDVCMSEPDILKLSSKTGDTVMVYTYLAVKEDGMYLYGFLSTVEKNLFLHLNTVNGVGPKLALTILSGIDANNLISAIMSGNSMLLNGIKGVGKKTAERIIIELRDKINKAYAGEVEVAPDDRTLNSIQADAVSALVALGFKNQDAVSKVLSVYSEGMNITQLINKALRA